MHNSDSTVKQTLLALDTGTQYPWNLVCEFRSQITAGVGIDLSCSVVCGEPIVIVIQYNQQESTITVDKQPTTHHHT